MLDVTQWLTGWLLTTTSSIFTLAILGYLSRTWIEHRLGLDLEKVRTLNLRESMSTQESVRRKHKACQLLYSALVKADGATQKMHHGYFAASWDSISSLQARVLLEQMRGIDVGRVDELIRRHETNPSDRALNQELGKIETNSYFLDARSAIQKAKNIRYLHALYLSDTVLEQADILIPLMLRATIGHEIVELHAERSEAAKRAGHAFANLTICLRKETQNWMPGEPVESA